MVKGSEIYFRENATTKKVGRDESCLSVWLRKVGLGNKQPSASSFRGLGLYKIE